MTAKKLSVDALGALIDHCWSLRSARLAAQRDVDTMKEFEDAMTVEVGEALRAAKLDGAKGKAGSASIKRSVVPSIVDEAAFFAWGSKKANYDCMKVGIVAEAWRLRVAEGVLAPGTEKFTKETVTVTGPK